MNTSGIRPMEYNVLVKPTPVETKTKGGLLLAESTVEKEEFGRMDGVLVAVSPMAFTFEDWPEGARGPQVGDRVVFSRYQATELTGADGAKYWMMKDRSIAGVME
jgi:co-chaperonin GroES (HSP10)